MSYDVWSSVLTAERAAGLPRLSGSRLTGIVPIREELLERFLAEWRPPRAVEALGIRFRPGNVVALQARVRVFGFSKAIQLLLRVAPAIQPGPPRRLYLFHADRSLLSNVLSFAGGMLPAWLSVADNGFVVDVDALADRAGVADLAPHLRNVAFEGQNGVLWVNFEVLVSGEGVRVGGGGAAGHGRTSRQAGPALDLRDVARLLGGARFQARLRVEESLVNDLAAAGMTLLEPPPPEAAHGPRVARADWRTVVRLAGAPRVSFESGAAVVEAAVAVPGPSAPAETPSPAGGGGVDEKEVAAEPRAEDPTAFER